MSTTNGKTTPEVSSDLLMPTLGELLALPIPERQYIAGGQRRSNSPQGGFAPSSRRCDLSGMRGRALPSGLP